MYYNINVIEGRDTTPEYVTMLLFSLLSLLLFYGMTCLWGHGVMRAYLARRSTVSESFAGDLKADVFVDDDDASTRADRRRRSARHQSDASETGPRTAFSRPRIAAWRIR